MSGADKEPQWIGWVREVYSTKYNKFLKAEAYISDLAGTFFQGKNDSPFIKTRVKSLPSFIGKVQRKLDENNESIQEFVATKKQIKKLFFDNDGIGDLVGMRLIFLRFPDIEFIRTRFVTNFLVGEKGFRGSDMNDVKNEVSGYKAFHFKLQFPQEKYDNINLEIQCMGMIQHLWMEAEHNLLYKQKKSLPPDQINYMRDIYHHLSNLIQEVESILFLPWK